MSWGLQVAMGIKDVMEYILESEMGGKLDKEDPYYPTYITLQWLKQKIEDENEITMEDYQL